MSVFFISDLHLGHENMAIKRGFSCADEMNEYIIKSWNSVIDKIDLTTPIAKSKWDSEYTLRLVPCV